MKKSNITIWLSFALAFAVLSGCATTGGDHTAAQDDGLSGKSWKSGPDDHHMWNVWTFNKDGTFRGTHYHSADNSVDLGVYTYHIKDTAFTITAPDKSVSEYTLEFINHDRPAFVLKEITGGKPLPHGGNDTYTQLHGDELAQLNQDGSAEHSAPQGHSEEAVEHHEN
ncbi:hypothetical protein [Treponema primitia]|uniref:hypothetical protein n=1 Tax=Treponema primitia TaxID=88058 RepID=UPI00025552EF|nr:hypothetical protein [Treponema primitia]